MNERILVATIVGPGKRHCARLLFSQLSGLESREYLVAFGGRPFSLPEGAQQIHCAPIAGQSSFAARAYAREAIRQAFLSRPFWKWLYWHDADMEAPSQAISKLLATARASGADVAAASYYLRGKRGPALPVLLAAKPDRGAPFKLARSPRGLAKEGHSVVDAVGLGATLVSRRALESVPFLSGTRNACPDAWREDIAWSLRASEQGFRVVLDSGLLARHLDQEGNDPTQRRAEPAPPAPPALSQKICSVAPDPTRITSDLMREQMGSATEVLP